jgi:signal transduction histidine kinase
MQSDDTSARPSLIARFATLCQMSTSLLAERDEQRLLQFIVRTACELTGAAFAAFSLRPLDERGQPLGPSDGRFFHLAAVVGVNQEQEALFRQVPLGGEGLLAPIFRYGVAVRIGDMLEHEVSHYPLTSQARDIARELAASYAQGDLAVGHLRSLGLPAGHPLLRSFLGAPLLDLTGQVRGGLLLGHPLPGQFSEEDELLLVGLAAQAAVALENRRLLRASEAQAQELRAIFEHSTDGMLLVDPDGRILRENSPARDLRQYIEHTPDGTRLLEEYLFTPARLALQSRTPQQSSMLLAHDHEEQPYVITAAPLCVPAPGSDPGEQSAEAAPVLVGSVVVWHDATEMRRLLLERQQRDEIEARRALLQRILDELPTSVYLVRGPDACLVLANRAATTLWGAAWPPGQSMQAFLRDQQIRISQTDGRPLPPEHLATLRAARDQETVRSHQEVIRHSDGTSLPVLVHAVALDLQGWHLTGGSEDGPATTTGALVVHQDISALKEAEQLKDEFIGIAAHELRTPLAVLKGFAQTLLVQTARQQGSELVEWQREALEGIDQATARLVELVDDLLDVSRLQAGHFPLNPVPSDLVALTKRVVARLQRTTDRHQLQVQTDSEYLVALVDPPRLEQVLTNLLTNAMKYSPSGGPIRIALTSHPEEHLLQISIADQGIGIPQQQQAQIFGRFARAENARQQGIGGTGLGLYLCRELVEQHQGNIWFESEENNGSTFFLTLPLLPEQDAE